MDPQSDPIRYALSRALAGLALSSLALEDAWRLSEDHNEVTLIEGLKEKTDKLGSELSDYLDPPETD